MSKYWSDIVSRLTPYTPGEQPKDKILLKLNTNENPYSPSTKVLDSIKLNAKDTPHKLLAPGMLATVDHQLAVQHNALMVPEMAVSTDIKGNYVYKVDHNHVDKTYVVEGQHLNGLIQIKSGLSFGDVVVTAGQQKLEDHALIKILKHT